MTMHRTGRSSAPLHNLSIEINTSTVLDKYPAKQHAQRVATELGVEKGLIYLPGAPTVNLEDSDQPRPFRQRRYFAYLSGVDEPDCHVTYEIEHDRLTLWLPPIDPRRVVWVGRGSTTDEALEKYDIDDAKYTNRLETFLKQKLRSSNSKLFVLHVDQAPIYLTDSSSIDHEHLRPAVDACRVIKDDHEIKLIKKANAISAAAHTEVLRNLKRFRNEAQVEARFLDVCVANDAKHQAYEIIAGSGTNASILHYVKNNEPFGDRQLMCLDAGAEWQLYASDVTRTFPLCGNWPSKEAKEVYDLVQRMQTRCLNYIGPGKRFLSAHYLAHATAIDGLMRLGILHNGTFMEIFQAGTQLAFFPHGLGHHLGLEVHDVSPLTTASTLPLQTSELPTLELIAEPDLEMVLSLASALPEYDPGLSLCSAPAPRLKPGMVITVEPGIYFNPYALDNIYLKHPVHSKYINKEVLKRYMPVGGVRIEDDILITEEGYENLTTAPKGEEALRIIRGDA